MFGFDDAAQMGLGAINAGVQIFGANKQARYNKQLQAIQRAQSKRKYEDQMTNLDLGKMDVTRENYINQQNAANDIADQQGPGGSMQQVVSRRMGQDADRRLGALGRQETMAKADWLDQQRMWDIQDKMAKSAQTMSMISGLLMQGGSGAASAMGAG